MRALKVAPLLMLPLLLGSVPSQVTSTVGGIITEAGSTAPVNLVAARVVGLEIGVRTNRAGEFVLSNVPLGTHQLEFGRECYHTVSVEIEITEAFTDVRLDLGLPLSQAGVQMGLCR